MLELHIGTHVDFEAQVTGFKNKSVNGKGTAGLSKDNEGMLWKKLMKLREDLEDLIELVDHGTTDVLLSQHLKCVVCGFKLMAQHAAVPPLLGRQNKNFEFESIDEEGKARQLVVTRDLDQLIEMEEVSWR